MKQSLLNQSPLETDPVGTKLIDSVTLHFPFPRETRVHNRHSILYDALPPISRPAEHESPEKTHKAMGAH